MSKYKIQIPRYIKEYINIEVEADDDKSAILKGYEAWAFMDGTEIWKKDLSCGPRMERPIVLSKEEEAKPTRSLLEIVAENVGVDLSAYKEESD